MLNDHETLAAGHVAAVASAGARTAAELRQLCLDAGADDVGFVAVADPALDADRRELAAVAPWAQTAIGFVCRMNREPLRSPARSLANLEFHQSGDRVNGVARRIVAALERNGVRAVNPAMGFPMEMERFPARTWVVSHKRVAEAAGLGRMGIHRNVIHPRFGNFILLGTVLSDLRVDAPGRPLEFNPCLTCKLCVAACPVGAIAPDGRFHFAACYTHNYREFMGGFTDWVEQVADSRDARDYRRRVGDGESASMWQSLSFGANYKAAYCMAVCPAGEEVRAPFDTDRPAYLEAVVRPLQQRPEAVYVVADSDAEAHVRQRFPHKSVRRVRSGLRPVDVRGFLASLPLVFNPGRSRGLTARYHFVFTGAEPAEATVVIDGQSLAVSPGLHGRADLRVTADSATWVGFLRRDRSLFWALLRGRIRLWGSPSLLRRFARCFPS